MKVYLLNNIHPTGYNENVTYISTVYNVIEIQLRKREALRKHSLNED